MKRTFELGVLNVVANDPTIRPMLGGEGEIDLTKLIGNPENYLFANEKGGFVVVPLLRGGTVYECHTIFKDAGFGEVVSWAKQCQEYMFTRTNCDEIVTKVPGDRPDVNILARRVHFEERFAREGVWKPGVSLSYRSLPLDRWLQVCFTTLEAGNAFHALLTAAKEAKGSKLPVHADDELHDRWVGAVILMAQRGQVVKGINAYNRWSSFAGYATIELISEVPPVVDIRDAVVGVTDGNMEVLLCR